jgi:hypothetical protein
MQHINEKMKLIRFNLSILGRSVKLVLSYLSIILNKIYASAFGKLTPPLK